EYLSLERNVRLNGLLNVSLFQAAVSSRSGHETFTYSARRATQGKLIGVEPTYINHDAECVTVQSITIDSVVADGAPPPELIKIDVEGAASLVLAGAVQVLDSFSPPIYIELHGPEEQAAVRDHLLARGYVAETVDGAIVEDPTQGWHSPLWCHKKQASRKP